MNFANAPFNVGPILGNDDRGSALKTGPSFAQPFVGIPHQFPTITVAAEEFNPYRLHLNFVEHVMRVSEIISVWKEPL
jgi:hypothetical protein